MGSVCRRNLDYEVEDVAWGWSRYPAGRGRIGSYRCSVSFWSVGYRAWLAHSPREPSDIICRNSIIRSWYSARKDLSEVALYLRNCDEVLLRPLSSMPLSGVRVLVTDGMHPSR
jgi:hypothetical protein